MHQRSRVKKTKRQDSPSKEEGQVSVPLTTSRGTTAKPVRLQSAGTQSQPVTNVNPTTTTAGVGDSSQESQSGVSAPSSPQRTVQHGGSSGFTQPSDYGRTGSTGSTSQRKEKDIPESGEESTSTSNRTKELEKMIEALQEEMQQQREAWNFQIEMLMEEKELMMGETERLKRKVVKLKEAKKRGEKGKDSTITFSNEVSLEDSDNRQVHKMGRINSSETVR